jgi:hypothetical protein
LPFAAFVLFCGAQDNIVRVKTNNEEINWEENLKIGRKLFAKKCNGARSYELTNNRKKPYTLYFKNIEEGPLNFLVFRDEEKNKESKYYKLISSMDSESELNKRIARQLFVSSSNVFSLLTLK